MDNDRIKEIGKACFLASCKGYIGTFDEHDNTIRMVLTAPDGHRVSGEFKPTKEEAVESCAMQFLKTDHDTSSRTSDN